MPPSTGISLLVYAAVAIIALIVLIARYRLALTLGLAQVL